MNEETIQLLMMYYRKLKIEYNEIYNVYEFHDKNDNVALVLNPNEVQSILDKNNNEHDYRKKLANLTDKELNREAIYIIEKYFDLGDDLNGNNLNYRDLELALMIGRDLDGVDIPGDTPEERAPIKKEEKNYEK
jgi:hypothetical protein